MNREYLYLVPFKPAMMKKKSIEKAFNHDGMLIGIYGKNFGSTYPCVRIESDHQLDPLWITGILSEYGEVNGSVSEYTFTSDPEDLPSRPLRADEAQNLEKQLRKAYTAEDWLWIIVFGLVAVFFAVLGVVEEKYYLFLFSIVFIALCILSIKVHIRSKKEAAEMQFYATDWTAIDCMVCNSWAEERVETRTEEGKEVTEHVTYYYHELSAGNLAFDNRYGGDRRQIGDKVTIFYNLKDKWIRV